MRPTYSIAFRHGGRNFTGPDVFYACDIQLRSHPYTRIATVPMMQDARTEEIKTPIYALRLLRWHERKAKVRRSNVTYG